METNKPTVNQRQLAWESMCQDEAVLLLNKGADYTAGRKDADAYANFRIIADLLKGAPITPYTVAMVYALKHVLSLITFAKTGKQESGEGLRGRHMDARNYFFILNELVPDHVNSTEKMVMRELDELIHERHLEARNEELRKLWGDGFTLYVNDCPDYSIHLNEEGTQYWDPVTKTWQPLSKLDERKEVSSEERENANPSTVCCLCCNGIGPLVQIGDLRGEATTQTKTL